MFLSRLNPVSVFHIIYPQRMVDSNGVFLSRLNPVSVFHCNRFWTGSTWICGLFLSRLNPVSVFHVNFAQEYMVGANCFYPA